MRYIIVLFTLLFVPYTVVAGSLKTYNAVPDGFEEYVVQQGDSWSSIVPNQEDLLLAMRINRVDAQHLRAGMQVIIPVDTAAYRYIPVPKVIETSDRRQLVVFLKEQYFGAYEQGKLVHWGPVSSGKKGRGTPTGTYVAKWKDRWHRSSLYKNAKMYFAVQFQGNYFTHQSPLPGYPASHGCVRMLEADAAWKFAWIRVGDTVRIVHSTGDL